MLEEFRLQIKKHWDTLKGNPLRAALKRAEVEDEIMRPPLYKAGLDLRSEKFLANFTIWGSGETQVIIMSQETGEEIIVDDRKLKDPKELQDILTYYFNALIRGEELKKYPLK
jgi:hypothetical protein